MLEVLYDVLWIVIGIVLYAIALIPGYFIVHSTIGQPLYLFLPALPAAFFAFVIALIIVTGVVKLLFVPRLRPGFYEYPRDQQTYVWIANMWITQYVMFPFGRLIFLSASLRYLCLRLYGVRLHFSTNISTGSSIGDFDLLRFGRNTIIGGFAIAFAHVWPKKGKLLMAETKVGDNTMVGGRSILGCGSTIGNNVFMGFGCETGIESVVGDDCHLGPKTTLGNGCVLEPEVEIGKCCVLGHRTVVRRGLRIPDYAMVADGLVIETQEAADGVRLTVTHGPGEGKAL